jgi:hypothetical protein
VVTVVRELSATAPDGLMCATVAANMNPPLHRNTAWYRIRAALRLGLLVNAETRKGHPAKLKPGDAMPDEREALPTVQQLAALIGSSFAESTSTVESMAEDVGGAASAAVQADGLATPEPPVEPPSDHSGIDGGAAIQRFNSKDADPMYHAALDIFGTHDETPMA